MTKQPTEHDRAIQQFFIPSILPGLNDMIASAKVRRGKWSAYAEQKKTYEGIISCYLNDLKPVDSMVWVSFIWVEKAKRRDLDNIAAAKKFIFDALVKKGILKNDGWKNVAGWTDQFLLNPKKPGVKVIIREIENGEL
jgi:Holliday junction resolvase RusA-like endonuclease